MRASKDLCVRQSLPLSHSCKTWGKFFACRKPSGKELEAKRWRLSRRQTSLVASQRNRSRNFTILNPYRVGDSEKLRPTTRLVNFNKRSNKSAKIYKIEEPPEMSSYKAVTVKTSTRQHGFQWESDIFLSIAQSKAKPLREASRVISITDDNTSRYSEI